MRRRIVSLFICFVLISVFAAVASACVKPGEREHAHVYSEEWVSDSNSHWHVCTVEGCKSILEKVDHDFEVQIIKEATCVQQGQEKHVCKTCGYEQTVQTAKTDHSYVEYESTEPTCTQFGNTQYKRCELCGLETEHESFAPLGHLLEDHDCVRCEKSLYDSNLYGYGFFATMEKGDAMQSLYDKIAEAAIKFDRDTVTDVKENTVLVTIDYASLGLDSMQAMSVWKTFKDDNPIYYWMSNTVTLSDNGLEIYVDNEYRLGKTREYCNALIDEAVMELAGLVYAGATIYDIALCYHDNIALAIDYAYDSSNNPETAVWAHNIIGVLEKRGAVCEGYARTFQLLLNYSDVENIFVTGESQGVNHAWNMVKLEDGKWYWCDLTFDDSTVRGYGYSHNYYVQTDENFLKNHIYADSSREGIDFLYDLPERSDTAYVPEEITLGTQFDFDGMKFKIIGYNEVTLLEFNRPATQAIIPESVTFEGRNMKVTSVGEEHYFIFDDEADVKTKSVVIPSTVRNIWDNALSSRYLENINVSSDNMFYASVDGVLYTKDLLTLIKFPSASQITTFTVPYETNYIAYRAFENCKNLSSFTLGANVNIIGVVNWGIGYPAKNNPVANVMSGETGNIIDSLAGEKQFSIHPENKRYVIDGPAVYNANKTVLYYVYDWVTEMVIPSTLKDIEEYGAYDMFYSCNKLEKFVMDKNTEYFAVDGGLLYNGDFTELYSVPKRINGHVIIHDGIDMIESFLFSHCEYITEITLPESVELISVQAFMDCSSLVRINLNEGLKNIDYNAFANCKSLKEITIPSTVSDIGKNVFYGCSSLEKIVFAKPSGWTATYNDYSGQDTRTFSEEELSNPVRAKDFMTGKYISYEWKRN